MNLHAIASSVISAVNPTVPLSVQICLDYQVGSDGKRTPVYQRAIQVPGQVQNLTFRDLAQLEGLNLQGIRRAIYINGRIDGLVRSSRKGGDMITIDPGVYGPDSPGQVWLVAQVLEAWPDWTKCACTLQNNA